MSNRFRGSGFKGSKVEETSERETGGAVGTLEKREMDIR